MLCINIVSKCECCYEKRYCYQENICIFNFQMSKFMTIHMTEIDNKMNMKNQKKNENDQMELFVVTLIVRYWVEK